MRARSIPEEHEAKVLRWFLAGDSYRAIADRLSGEHEVKTSPGSVSRMVDRITDGSGVDSVARTVTKIRLKSPRLAEQLERQTAMANKLAGIDEDIVIAEGVTRGDIDFANRLTIRELKVAGCVGIDADRAMLRLRHRSNELCRDEEGEEQERMAAAIVAPPRPIAEPPPEPLQASSNGRFAPSGTAASAVDGSGSGTGSGGGPPCPPRGSAAGDSPGSAALHPGGHGGPPPLEVADSCAGAEHSSPPRSVTVSAKQGRNDSCFCGSGKKYKKCCGGPNGRPRGMLGQPTNLQPLAGCPAVRPSNVLPSASGDR